MDDPISTALKTFNGDTPETSDVVLCHYCGNTLHDDEHDVRWDDNQSHVCVPMLENTIQAQAINVKALVEALDELFDLNDNGGPFGGEIYQDRVELAWISTRDALAAVKETT